MQSGSLKAVALHMPRQPRAPELAVVKNKRLSHRMRANHVLQRRAFGIIRHAHKTLRHRSCCGIATRNLNRYWVLQIACRQPFDFWRKGSRKKQGDALLGQKGQNAL